LKPFTCIQISLIGAFCWSIHMIPIKNNSFLKKKYSFFNSVIHIKAYNV
jgi:hypothetical protein